MIIEILESLCEVLGVEDKVVKVLEIVESPKEKL